MTPFWQSKPPIYLGRARRESLHAQAPHRAGDGLVSGHRVNLLERYDYPKVLWFDGQGLMLLSKRLERGRFVWPQATSGGVALTPAQLSMLLEGIDWRMPLRTHVPELAA